MTATHAKQHFGDALAASSQGPVSITKHGKVVAVLTAATDSSAALPDAERRFARERQVSLELRRLVRHQQIAITMLSSPSIAATTVDAARRVVEQWEQAGSCSGDYIRAWKRLLALPTEDLARRMCGELNGWGVALRQNSPFRSQWS